MQNIETLMNLLNQFPNRVIQLYGINENGYCTCLKGKECSSAGKHPVKSNWKNCTIKSEDEMRETLKSYPYSNFGIVTGDGLVVIDIDPRHDGLKSLKKIKQFLPISVLTVRTGGNGYHFYYETDKPIGNKTNVLPGIDIRGDGGFVVAPYSSHKSGNYYEFIENNEVQYEH